MIHGNPFLSVLILNPYSSSRAKKVCINPRYESILGTNKYLKGKVEHLDSTMEMWNLREQARMMAEEIIFAEIVNQFH